MARVVLSLFMAFLVVGFIADELRLKRDAFSEKLGL